MAVQIRMADEADAAELGQVRYAAFKDNQIDSAIFPMHHRETMPAWFHEQHVQDLTSPDQDIIVAVDPSTSTIAASMRWFYPRDPAQEDGTVGSSRFSEKGHVKASSLQLPRGSNTALGEAFFRSLSEKQDQYISPGRDYSIKSMSTRPEYRGKGYASKLLQWAIESVPPGAGIYLESTVASARLYEKHGWKTVDYFITNLGDFGAKGTEKTLIMYRG